MIEWNFSRKFFKIFKKMLTSSHATNSTKQINVNINMRLLIIAVLSSEFQKTILKSAKMRSLTSKITLQISESTMSLQSLISKDAWRFRRIFLTLISCNRSGLKLFCFSWLAFTAGLWSTLRATSMIESLNSVGVDCWISDYAFHSLTYTGFTLNYWPPLTFC